MESSGFSICIESCHLHVMTVLPLPFQLGYLLFFPFLMTVARNSSAMLNRSGESEHACRVSAFSEPFSFPSLTIMLAVCLSYIAFVVLR